VFAVVDFVSAAAVFTGNVATPLKLRAARVVVRASVIPAAIALVKLAFVATVVVSSAMAMPVTSLIFVLAAALVGERQAAGQQSGSSDGTYGGRKFLHNNL
jgi:hypothetical protein